MQNIRVLWIGHFAPYPPKGGAMQRSFNMLKQMAEFATVDLVTLSPRSKVTAYYEDFQIGQDEIQKSLSEYVDKYISVPHGSSGRKVNKYIFGLKSLLSRAPYDVLALRSALFNKALLKQIVLEQYDVIYVDTVGLCSYIKDVSVPVIVNHHNIESHMLMRRAENCSGLLRWYLKWQSRKTLEWEKYWGNQVALNIVCSTIDKDRLSEYVSSEIEVIPNGVDIEYFTRKEEYNEKKVAGCIFAGGLEWYPNAVAVDFIVNEIEPLYSEKVAGGPITICGKGRHKGLAEKSDKSKKIVAAGFVNDVRVPMEEAALYLCPINDGGGTKLKVLDALAMGIPVIAHPIACEGIDVVNGKEVAYATTPEEYVAKIESLMENPELRKSMSDAGILLIKNLYSYSIIGAKMREVFYKVVNQRGKI